MTTRDRPESGRHDVSWETRYPGVGTGVQIPRIPWRTPGMCRARLGRLDTRVFVGCW